MDYIIHLLIFISIYAILAMSLNLLVGYTGLLSVTHAAFYGVGAYTTALLMKFAGFNFFIALAIGVVIALIASFLIGLVISKLSGDYYALGSLGFNIIVFTIFLNWQTLTRGPLGIPGIPRPELFGFTFSGNIAYLALSFAFAVLVYLACRFIIGSSFGRALKAIREDEEALKCFGYHTSVYKLVIFAIAAGFASVAGALYASYITFVDPTTFYLPESVLLLSMIILGGLSNLQGSVIGAAVLILLPEALRFVGFPDTIAAQLRLFVYGLLIVLLMLYRPQGIRGEYKL
ncbi:MAG: branched-chain amino acid ABC transporter permease [Candidatus Jacksonbacteria bacterium RIFOXYA2_FULL_44_7]|uniref:Branched-chain amino acid ABC transporter permease n=1 Tax=Candidatus Jacksonbacteria bacterium RIFCSPLOWO2_02_FULL_44_20 TaxID=1798460 RepID=A0A1G2A907_9BACT|nr:MAG: branched-chain amino acid ABC transporter permease [Candidatus Jacksonbacteria bacterium RIFCSPHIGHO2_02_FULL_44_25]OGY73344.1 MAG: branched-chain amino acid ABC transporter permease [Candidatus Jacksonbacteria bacterium RIFCSPLOWO2_02_FULL_44_20]OGY74438.1 MAG: branched-chain amino acid ABC transporter permease [Candidatus Jacksonbacteria bacterium RIFCSPLOWO2_12_FULL_44_15b]OGY75598.1 MAG: branched-chain amino acid ABC transporter permease [Candidatus Jacksonbacteria bacterium RIFOXYA2